VLFKDQAFREEDEWRLVSPVISNYLTAPIKFREGRSLLTPYINFDLPAGDNRRVESSESSHGCYKRVFC
jgi:hypothetical protein